jgi:hypothetical protein
MASHVPAAAAQLAQLSPRGCPRIRNRNASPVAADLEDLASIEREFLWLASRSPLFPAGLGGLGGLPRVSIVAAQPRSVLTRWLSEWLRRQAELLTRHRNPVRSDFAWKLIQREFGPFASADDVRAHVRAGRLADGLDRRPDLLRNATYREAVRIAWGEAALNLGSLLSNAPSNPSTHLSRNEEAGLRLAHYALVVAGVCSVPVWTFFCGVHGTAAVDHAMPGLDDALTELTQVLPATRREVEALLTADTRFMSHALTVAGIPSFLDEVFGIFGKVLREKRRSVAAFHQWQRAQPERTRPAGTSSFSVAAHPEKQWGVPELWATTERLGALVAESGFRLWVNAASNRYGGRNPPHQTHNSGREIDVGFGLTERQKIVPLHSGRLTRTLDLIDDLAPLPPTVFHTDPRHGPQTLQPAPRGSEIITYRGVARLACWVVLQGLPLAGFARWFFHDAQNMRMAFAHLSRAIELVQEGAGATPVRREWDPQAVNSASRVETRLHHNHIHVELLPSVRPLLSPSLREGLTELAVAREQDPQFQKEMFAESGIHAIDRHIPAIRDDWQAREGGPPLLPVWIPGLVGFAQP